MKDCELVGAGNSLKKDWLIIVNNVETIRFNLASYVLIVKDVFNKGFQFIDYNGVI